MHKAHSGAVQDSQWALDQVLALVTASHPRCGARSPARHFVSLSPLATAPLWDWCLRDSEVVFGLAAWHQNPLIGPLSSFVTFGVSAALMGITRDVKLHGTWSLWDAQVFQAVVDPHRFVYVSEVDGLRFRFSLMSLPTGESQSMFTALDGVLCHQSSRRWWIHCGSRERLTIVNLEQLPNQQHQFDPVTVDIPQCYKEQAADGALSSSVMGIIFSSKFPDEALITLAAGLPVTSTFFLLIDVNRTYISGRIALLSMTKCDLGRGGLVQKRTYGPAIELTEVTGTTKQLASHVREVSQLGTFLFCIAKTDSTVEVWDCRSAEGSTLVRILEARPNASPLVTAHSGFLFHRHRSQLVDLTDPFGRFICTITLPITPKSVVVTSF
ncbi:hypothetical protein Pelo_8724 [Pelomyxa schiedti]|nr:hypothetical protein Pelo_8724 [Pelomyxa schiedti]